MEPDAEAGMCVGCGQDFDLTELDEDGLCKDCLRDLGLEGAEQDGN